MIQKNPATANSLLSLLFGLFIGLLASLVIRAERPSKVLWTFDSEEPDGALAYWITLAA